MSPSSSQVSVKASTSRPRSWNVSKMSMSLLFIDRQFRFPYLSAGSCEDGSFLRAYRTVLYRWGILMNQHDGLGYLGWNDWNVDSFYTDASPCLLLPGNHLLDVFQHSTCRSQDAIVMGIGRDSAQELDNGGTF